MITLARSQSPWGPFESCPDNPILTHRNLGAHPIQGTGHGDLIQAHDESWWMVLLGFRPIKQYANYHHLGRETFLAPVTWSHDGWLEVNHRRTIDLEMEAQTLPESPMEAELVRDDFTLPILQYCWNFLRNPYPETWSLTDRPGWLRLKGSPITLNEIDSPAFIGRRQQHMTCTASTSLDFSPAQAGEEAGLTVFMNEQHHYEIGITIQDSRRIIFVRQRIGDLSATVAQIIIPDGIIELHIQATPEKYSFAWNLEGQGSQILATGATRYLSSEVAGGFTGVYFGMYATGSGHSATNLADFDWFDYQPA
jgi:alpha-N-arabinofuranosidase